MILPPDNSLQLDSSNDGFVAVETSEQVAPTLQSLLDLLPAVFRAQSSAVRDAWLTVCGYVANTLQARYSFIFKAQQSPRWAEDIWLDAFGLLLGKPRIPLESDPDYRTRLLTPLDVVSPSAIKAAINAVILQFLGADANIQLVYNEPGIDFACCAPATVSDPVNPNAEQQFGTIPTWSFWTQPQANASGVGSLHQTIYVNKNFRLWGNDPNQLSKKYGAFSVPLNGAQFWIISPGEIGDDSQAPFCHSLSDTDVQVAAGIYDQTYGISGATTTNQSVVAVPLSSTPVPCIAGTPDSLIDRIRAEVDRRRAGGVGWIFISDYPSYLSF